MSIVSDDIILDAALSKEPMKFIATNIKNYDISHLISTCKDIKSSQDPKDSLLNQLNKGADLLLAYFKQVGIDVNDSKYNDVITKNFGLFVPKTRDKIYSMMDKGGTFLIKFKKVSDGSIRHMACTRDWDKLAKEKVRGFVPPKGTSTRKVDPNQVIIWDLGKNGFRSFKVNTLISIDRVSDKLVSYYNVYISMTKDEFVDLLERNVVKIKYKKLDNTKREMRCTRDISGFKDESKNNKITVYDLDKRDYRNIIFENVLSINEVSDDKSKKSGFLSRIRNLFRR
jgi:hypothetical protein